MSTVSHLQRRFFVTCQRYLSIPKLPNHPRLTAVPRKAHQSSIRTFSNGIRVQQPRREPQNYYELFPRSLIEGPPPKGPFNPDLHALRAEYLKIQSQAHPDRHLDPQDKARAEGTSGLINEAYRTLQDPLRRAQYVLSLRGIDVAEDETAKVQDADLLADVLETRQAIEDAETEWDITLLRTVNEYRIEESEKLVAEHFDEDDIEEAKAETVRLRYWYNIREAIASWEKGKPVEIKH